jgi:hypothetical protein
MFKVNGGVRKAGWISVRVIGVIGATIVAMTCDARDTHRDGRDAVHTDAHTGGYWCMAFDRDSRRNCAYLTFDQCLKAVDPIGGTCRPNPAALLIADDGPYRTYRSI